MQDVCFKQLNAKLIVAFSLTPLTVKTHFKQTPYQKPKDNQNYGCKLEAPRHTVDKTHKRDTATCIG